MKTILIILLLLSVTAMTQQITLTDTISGADMMKYMQATPPKVIVKQKLTIKFQDLPVRSSYSVCGLYDSMYGLCGIHGSTGIQINTTIINGTSDLDRRTERTWSKRYYWRDRY